RHRRCCCQVAYRSRRAACGPGNSVRCRIQLQQTHSGLRGVGALFCRDVPEHYDSRQRLYLSVCTSHIWLLGERRAPSTNQLLTAMCFGLSLLMPISDRGDEQYGGFKSSGSQSSSCSRTKCLVLRKAEYYLA